MKSVISEASTIAKAIELGLQKANQPKEFLVKIFQEAEHNMFGMTKVSAKVGIFYDDTAISRKIRSAPTSNVSIAQRQQKPAAQKPKPRPTNPKSAQPQKPQQKQSAPKAPQKPRPPKEQKNTSGQPQQQQKPAAKKPVHKPQNNQPKPQNNRPSNQNQAKSVASQNAQGQQNVSPQPVTTDGAPKPAAPKKRYYKRRRRPRGDGKQNGASTNNNNNNNAPVENKTNKSDQ